MVVGRIGGGIQKKRWGPGTYLYHQYLLEVGNISENFVGATFELLFDPKQFLLMFLTPTSLSLVSLLSSLMMDPPFPKAIMP